MSIDTLMLFIRFKGHQELKKASFTTRPFMAKF